MIGFNHATAGGLISKFLPWPIALPLAFVSHFALDALPHYGIPNKERDDSHFWKYFFTADFIATIALGLLAIATHHYTALACGLVAVMPDFLWVLRIVRTRSFDLSTHNHWFTKWHHDIQRYERPWGLYIELPFAAFLATVVFRALA